MQIVFSTRLRRGMWVIVLLPTLGFAQGFREAPRAPAAGAVQAIQAPNSGPRAMDAQSAGAASNTAASAQLPAGPVKAPSADLSVEDMIKALSGGLSQAGAGPGAANAPGAAKGADGSIGNPAAANAALQSPGKGSPLPQQSTALNGGAMVDLTIQFAFDSATILDESKALLDRLAKALNAPQLQSLRFVVEGHTDGVGNKQYNDQLSARRAQSVVDYLVTGGVASTRLRSTGKGFSELLYPQDPKAAGNRRVRIKVGI
ncbi:MAG: OmpA family protein [Betaproteobacteria bacterium]|nr:OmpA family protein [Betaproteobacteria bacterium]NBO43257.1 OmpA family protein [Betaproteobacteria bacterium]NBP09253.1 OmpA family protein [Betaproteobacteria bacterium]NBP60621.1 OmpA family protein [Betaproteobacteria bacterium]NBQ07923.1 OmpA family protein [Betaproteobacteria bacterium]